MCQSVPAHRPPQPSGFRLPVSNGPSASGGQALARGAAVAGLTSRFSLILAFLPRSSRK